MNDDSGRGDDNDYDDEVLAATAIVTAAAAAAAACLLLLLQCVPIKSSPPPTNSYNSIKICQFCLKFYKTSHLYLVRCPLKEIRGEKLHFWRFFCSTSISTSKLWIKNTNS